MHLRRKGTILLLLDTKIEVIKLVIPVFSMHLRTKGRILLLVYTKIKVMKLVNPVFSKRLRMKGSISLLVDTKVKIIIQLKSLGLISPFHIPRSNRVSLIKQK